MQKVKNLIIIAGGDATRLQTFHQNYIPKLLLNIDTETVFAKMLNFWQDRVEYFHIVVKSKDELTKLKAYVELVFPAIVKNILFYIIDSSKHTLTKLDHVANFCSNNAYITWSDIWPTNIDEHSLDKNYIIVDEEQRHRYNFHDGKLEKCNRPNGNVCGMFYVHDVEILNDISSTYRIHYDLDEIDFTQALQTLIDDDEMGDEEFLQVEAKIFDVGDVVKYQNTKTLFNAYRNKFIQSRYFQKIEILDDKVIKSSRNHDGQKLIEAEIRYYEHLQINQVSNIFPKMLKSDSDYDETTLVLEKIRGRTVFEYLQSVDPNCENLSNAKNILNTFQTTIDKNLHSLQKSRTQAVNIQLFKIARMKEYYEVTSERLHKVLPFIDKIKTVNDENICSIESLLCKIQLFVELTNNNSFTLSYALIHGDTNTSNVMIDDVTKKLFLIDPRGTFGGLNLYGDKNYDIAKFIYGLSGYDNFNTSSYINFSMNHDQTEVKYSLPAHYNLDDLTDNLELKIIVSIIWIKLSAYIINDPIKCMIAYSHGSSMFNTYFNQFINNQK